MNSNPVEILSCNVLAIPLAEQSEQQLVYFLWFGVTAGYQEILMCKIQMISAFELGSDILFHWEKTFKLQIPEYFEVHLSHHFFNGYSARTIELNAVSYFDGCLVTSYHVGIMKEEYDKYTSILKLPAMNMLLKNLEIIVEKKSIIITRNDWTFACPIIYMDIQMEFCFSKLFCQ